MLEIFIDDQNCTGCGHCQEICPYQIIELVGEKAVITGEDCFLCGQCRAVCPTQAIEIPQLPTEIVFGGLAGEGVGDKNRLPNIVDLTHLMQTRRSCRNYKQDSVPLDVLEDLVKLGTTAPSGTNCQSWEFTILPTRTDVSFLGDHVAAYYKRLNRLAAYPFLRNILRFLGSAALSNYYNRYYDSVTKALDEWDKKNIDRLFHGAPAVLLVSAKTDASCPKEDAMLATQNILLGAHALGVGSCLIGFVVEAMRRSGKIRKIIGIPDDEEVFSVIALGYPAVHFLRPAGRKNIRPKVVRLGVK